MKAAKKTEFKDLSSRLKSLNLEKAKGILQLLKFENSSSAECPTFRCSGHSKGGHMDK